MRGGVLGPCQAAGLSALASWMAIGTSGLPYCTGAAAAAARLRLAAALLPCLPAARQLLSLHGLQGSSTQAQPIAPLAVPLSWSGPPLAAAAKPQLASSSGGGRPWGRTSMSAPRAGSAAQQLVSLRSFSAQRVWGGYWGKRSIYGSSRADSLGVVVSGGSMAGGGRMPAVTAAAFAAYGAPPGDSLVPPAPSSVLLRMWELAATACLQDKLHDEVPVVLPASHQRHLWEVGCARGPWALALRASSACCRAVNCPVGCGQPSSAATCMHSSPRTLPLKQVLEFRPDSTCLETWKSPDVLGLVRSCRLLLLLPAPLLLLLLLLLLWPGSAACSARLTFPAAVARMRRSTRETCTCLPRTWGWASAPCWPPAAAPSCSARWAGGR